MTYFINHSLFCALTQITMFTKSSNGNNAKYAQDFFSVNRWILRCAGLWRPSTINKYIQICYTFYAILVFAFVNLWFTFTEFVSLFYTFKNEYELIKNVNFFLTHFMGAIKVVFWYFYGNYLIRIMAALEDPQFYYEGYEKYQPSEISQRYKKIGQKYSLMFLLLAHATLTSSYIPPTITTVRLLKSSRNSTMLPVNLPYYSWMPFSYNTGLKYLLAMAYQAGPMFNYAYSIVGMDSLFINIINCITGNVVIIQGAFSTVRERCMVQHDTVASRNQPIQENIVLINSMKMELLKIVKHLQTLFKASEQLENVHRFVTLCQVTATLFILCTCLYLVSIAPPLSKQFLIEFVYMMAMSYQLYLYCWFGNEVTLKFQELPQHIWESNWLATDTQYKKSLMFTMLRTRKPVFFTAGRFSRLTLPTFMSILKTSYSIFALIKNTSN
ncbi:odorant receptor 2a-like isoform X2 [Euwallacea fornicatus]|uniref:odorant receptor 2a-like isoform X2 n=1 Tax=Euwallacea fornicatus TaxID=995702 RepID=UPI00338DD43D